MNWKRGFKRITICIAIVTGVICAIFSIGLILYMHGDARSYLKWTQDNYIKEYNPCKLEKITVENGGKTKYKCMNIVEFRQHYPSYDDVADTYLAATLHSKYYSDLPYTEFAVAFLGITEPPEGFVLDKPKSNINFVPVSITPEEAAAELLRRRVKRADFEERIAELEKGFWVNLSKKGLVGLCVLAGLIGAVVGFCGLWVVVWLLYRLFRWLILGFCGGEGKSGGREIILHAIANSDIFRVKQGTKVGDTVTSKNGYFLSDFYMKDVMEAKVVGFEDNDKPKDEQKQ